MNISSVYGGITHEWVEIQASMMAHWIAVDHESTLDPVLDPYKLLRGHRGNKKVNIISVYGGITHEWVEI